MAQHYVTLKDVARRADTTAATVSYVLNGKEGRYISKEMRQRVMDAIEELGYIKSSAASSLRGKKRGIIAVLIPQFENQFFTRIASAIENVADKKGYVLSISSTADDPQREQKIISRMLQQRVDGYILSPTREGGVNTEQLRSLGVPLVVVDRSLPGCEKYPWVTFNNYSCGYLAAEHFIKMGHRHIGLVNWDSGIQDLDERQAGFLAAMAKYQIHDCPIVCDGLFDETAGYQMTKRLLQTRPEVTGILYSSNLHAKGGIRYLLEAGLIIGEDISVIVVGSPEWATSGFNDFTHIVQHEHKIGACAAEMLMTLIDDPERMPEQVQFGCELHIGSSVKDLR